MAEFKNLESKIGINFKDKDLLKQAFVHRSYLNENPDFHLAHNERLEFLGDAVLELVVTDFLYKKYPEKQEGELTAYRAGIVNANILSEIGRDLSLGDFLLLSRGEAKDVGKARQYILANTIEALIGAIYLDSGYSAAEKFVAKFIWPRLDIVVAKGLWRDPKSFVQEMSQEHFGVTPNYKVLRESGPDHNKTFVSGIYFGETLVAEGQGRSKQEAEQEAALRAIEVNKWR
jgi:ribonuclease-3